MKTPCRITEENQTLPSTFLHTSVNSVAKCWVLVIQCFFFASL